MSWVEVDGAGWDWVDVNGAGWRWMQGLVIPIFKYDFESLRKKNLRRHFHVRHGANFIR